MPRRLPLAWVLVASFCLVPAVSLADEEPWVTLRPPSEGFSAQMPGEAKRRVKETSTFVGTVEDVSYRVERGDEVFMVNCVELPTLALFMPDSSLLNNIRESFLRDGTEKSYVDVERDGLEGKRLDFIMNKDQGRQDARAEFYLVDGNMLSFTGIVPLGGSMVNVDRFLASVELED